MFYRSVAVVAGLLAISPAALAAEMYKCTDNGRVTWQDHACDADTKVIAPAAESPVKAPPPPGRTRELKKAELRDPQHPVDDESQATNARRQHEARIERCRALQVQVERERASDYSVSPTVRKNGALKIEQLLQQARDLGC